MIVIGGGLAGLAASVALAESGWRVRLFEQRPFLGGRAASYELPNGEHVDNCQHVTFGCCTNLDDFYRRVGSSAKIKFFDRMILLDPQGRRGAMHAGFLPAPFHMTGSFLTFSPLSLKDKLGIGRAFSSILRSGGRPPEVETLEGISMLDWLERHKQTPAAISRFWRTVLVSALSEELDKIDARYGIDVFWKAVLSNKTGYRMGVPAVALGELYGGCKAFIEKQGGEVIFRSPLRELRIEGGRVSSAIFDAGRAETADSYILALPHSTLAEILPVELKQSVPAFRELDKIFDAPITGVHFWFDRQVMSGPFLSLLDTTTQWIFNKSALYGATNGIPSSTSVAMPAEKGQYLQLVISASYDLLQKPRQEIIDLCLQEVRHALPAAREANLLKATVIKEAAATFSPRPGVDRWRPSQKTSIPGLFLAGDWTATSWPATMEGAVRSGYLAAEAILSEAGNPKRFLRPDLKPDGLARFLAKP
ncbi:MAG TPA: hydroxysqualene dehydroxylase HpnE [Candidatus Acidoferrum sp.]|nr:hydroxysqualene dehydroxylase HpnE [Candidatus Acidoferrum sp.]